MMDPEDILAHFRSEADAAKDFYNSDVAERQANALDYYDSEPFGDEEEGSSTYIEPVVEQTVDDMVVDIMEAFVSGDRVVEFEANDEASEQAAMEATEALHYMYMRRQKGFRMTLDWIQSGLVEIVGVAKVICYEEKKAASERLTVPMEALHTLDPETVVAATDNGDGTWAVETKTQKMVKRYETPIIPSEEFRFSPRMKSLEDKVYRAHVVRKSFSDLVEMGFDPEILEELPTENRGWSDDLREESRHRGSQYRDQELKGARREYELHEEYDWLDIDGDNIVELIRVFRVGETILSTERWDEQPFVGWCPYPRAHRWVGKGLAEKVMPDQRVESVITRQMLDGLYASNAPRRWLPTESMTETTIDDLLNVRPGAIVRGRGLQAPVNLSENFDLGKSLALLERFSQRRQSRTGILELGKGMDKDALNDTASGQAQLMQAGEKQIRYVARNFGEAFAEMFLKLMRLVKKHGESMSIRIGKKWTEINPASWPEDMDLSIKVGLGTNGKDKRIANRMTLAQMQLEAKTAGMGIVNEKTMYNTVKGLARDMDVGNPDDYWIDPEGEEYQPPQPQQDPAMVKAQNDAQLAQQKMQMDNEAMQGKMAMQEAEAAAKLENDRERAQMEGQLARDKAAQEADLAERKFQMEVDMAERKFAFDAQMAQRQADTNDAMATRKADTDEKAKLSKNRPGGSLSE